METPYSVTDDIDILPSYIAAPGLGLIPVNAYLLRSSRPVLVDTGLHADADAFMDALQDLIDPKDLAWIWLTHVDQDHVGSLMRLVDAAPNARFVTNFLGAAKLGLVSPLPPDRLYFINPGQRLNAGDRDLVALRPPVYDAPETLGLYDPKSGTFFSSDCFGAVLTAPANNAADIPASALTQGQVVWATIDAPWIHDADEAAFAKALDGVRTLAPRTVLSSHLPPLSGSPDRILDTLAAAQKAPRFVGPDQAAIEALLKSAA